MKDLSARLGVSIARMSEIAENISSHYTRRPLRSKKNPNKIRMLTVPNGELKQIQGKIHRNILSKLQLEDCVHGGIGARSPKTNAQEHAGKACVVNADVRDFFPSIDHRVVYRLFRKDLGFGRDVSSLLTKLTTIANGIPQGAPTSTSIANLVLTTPVDKPLLDAASASEVKYSRFVDDLTFSGDDPRFMINAAAKLLSQRGLKLYRGKERRNVKAKLRITPRSQPQLVTGLNVNSSAGPSVPRSYRSRLRAEIRQLSGVVGQIERERKISSIQGKINYVLQFNPGAAERLRLYLAAESDRAARVT